MIMTTTELLDCGHAPTPTTGGGTGRAYDNDGRTLCYACADAAERARVAAGDTLVAYVSSTGNAITTWSGGELMRITSLTSAPIGWQGSRVYFVRAVAPDGSKWYGRNGGPGVYIVMKKVRVQ